MTVLSNSVFPANPLRRFLPALVALTLTAPATMLTSHAAAEPTSLFVLDVSGSMWGRLPGKQSKIVVAREVLSDIVTSLPDTIAAGLIAYGHRRKGDCRDIEMVQKPRKGSGAAIAKRLSRLIPRGRTPITDALKMAGLKLAGTKDAATIVLVSDGIETCKGDPCALAAALAKSNAKLNIHVVGYAVNARAQAQLQCIAEKGRGKYFTANDTGGLTKALTRVKKSIVENKPVEAVAQPAVTAAAKGIKIKLSGPGTIRLKLANWTKMPVYWKVLNPETGEVIAKTSKDKIEVLPGQYQIAWRHIEHGSKEVVLPHVLDVKPGMTTLALINTGLRLIPPKGMPKPYYWQLLPNGADLKKGFRRRQAAAHYYVWEPVPVPPGKYTLVLHQKEHGYSEAVLGTITLKDGEFKQVPLDQGININWPKSWKNLRYIRITSAGGHSLKTYKRGPLVLAPGTYKIAVRLNDHVHSEAPFGTIVVKEKGFVDAKLTSGITFETRMKGEFTVYAKNLDTGAQATMKGSWGPMPLGAGRYRFDLKLKGQKRQTLVPELKIVSGQFVKAQMN